MFNNIGGKIKKMASGLAWLGMSLGVLFGLSSMTKGQFIGGLLVIAFGFLSFPACYCLYGFGELVENVAKLVAKVEKHEE